MTAMETGQELITRLVCQRSQATIVVGVPRGTLICPWLMWHDHIRSGLGRGCVINTFRSGLDRGRY